MTGGWIAVDEPEWLWPQLPQPKIWDWQADRLLPSQHERNRA